MKAMIALALTACTFSPQPDVTMRPDGALSDGASFDASLTAPSCAGLASTCGSDGTDDCCSTAQPIPGGTFYRSYDVGSDGMFPDMSFPATVSPFVLDKYEVTVGRFRKFVEAGMGTQASPPAAGAGMHPHLADSGWDPSWNSSSLAANTSALIAALKCDATYQTWTDAPGSNEALPINCVTWFDAMAFCIWDGAYLPSEAEWNFAAAGGDEQRAYPWSNPPDSLAIDCAQANYDNGSNECVGAPSGEVNRVGSESPKGDGRWGQSDLGGNVWEWSLDWYTAQLPTSCDDCANLNQGSTCPVCPARTVQGGSFGRSAASLRAGGRGFSVPDERTGEFGIRCARL